MNLENARRDVWDKLPAKREPVNPEKIRKYNQEVAEHYSKYLVESRAAAKKTAEMSKVVCVA